MHRRDFGSWGIELTAGDFACALASLGVIGTIQNLQNGLQGLQNAGAESLANLLRIIAFSGMETRDPRTILSCFYGGYGRAYELAYGISPKNLADAWKFFIAGSEERRYNAPSIPLESRVRLEVHSHGIDMRGFIEELSRSEVGAASVYERNYPEPSSEISWEWPLQIGLLLDQDSSVFNNELRDMVNRGSWQSTLIQIFNLGGREDFEALKTSCGLLLIPANLRAAVAKVLQLETPVHADCVIVLGSDGETAVETYRLLSMLTNLTSSGGVAIVNIPSEKRISWVKEIVWELSHDEPLDIALSRATRTGEGRVPFLLASRKLITSSTVSRTIEDLTQKLTHLSDDLESIEIDFEQSRGFDISSGSYKPHDLADQLTRNKENRAIGMHPDGTIPPQLRFDSESNAASATARLKADLLLRFATAQGISEVQPRWLQAQAYDLSAPNEHRRLTRALRTNAPHSLVVRVGRWSEWMAGQSQFPELPPEEEQHELTVVFSEPRLFPTGPQVGTITLPGVGDSSECSFFFHTGTEITQVEGRIIVLHRNRVLQTALLLAGVSPEPYDTDTEIKFDIEAVVRPGINDLNHRQKFDGALIFNHATNRASGVTKLANDHAAFTKPSGLDNLKPKFHEFLTGIANNPEKYEDGLHGSGSVQLFRDLAEFGRQLYESIVVDYAVDNRFKDGRRIQIITAEPDAWIPVEFFYDKEMPEDDAALCPNVMEGLRQGACLKTCSTGDAQRSIVCPLGFWGLRKVIEHHLHVPGEYTAQSINGDFRFQAEPLDGRDTLYPLKRGVIAASTRADKLKAVWGGVDSVLEAIGKVSTEKPSHVHSWKDWVAEVKNTNSPPSLLVLLTHTELADNGAQQLVIEDGENVETLLRKIHKEHVRDPESNPSPVVMLMGCETGAAPIPMLGFVPKFRQQGAAIIVSTGSTVLGYQAAKVTREFVNTLAEVSQKGGTFGEVMLAVKQKMLADGLPMVMCLMAFGDADWRLVFRPSAGKTNV